MRSAGFSFYMCLFSRPGKQKKPRLNPEATAQKNKRPFHRSEKVSYLDRQTICIRKRIGQLFSRI